MNGEILRDEPIDVYHAAKAISSSKVKLFQESGPAALAAYLRGEYERPDTKAFAVGRFLDTLLTGDDWAQRYIIKPEGIDGRTKQGKEWLAKAEADGLEVVSLEDAAWARDAREAIMAIPAAADAIENAIAQVSFRAKLDEWSFAVQSRPDWWVEDGLARTCFEPLFPDLKTTADLPGIIEGRSIFKYGYDMQAALVRMTAGACGVMPTHHELICVTKKIPAQACVVLLTEEWLKIGERRVRGLLSRIDACARANHWPRVAEPVVEARVPGWLARENEIEDREDAVMEAA
jgi:hypothetical protein